MNNKYPYYKISSDGKLLWANPDLYIASTGQPYIDTGYVCNITTKVECVFSPLTIDTDPPTQTQLFGIGGKYGGTNAFIFFYWKNATTDNDVWWPYIGASLSGSVVSSGFSWEIGTKYKVIMNGKADGPQELYYANDELIKNINLNYSYAGSNANLFLFRISGYEGKETTKKKIYSFKIYESDVLIHNFVPVPAGLQIGSFTVPSNGMFDIVEQKFYANQGTGEFEFGLDNSDKWAKVDEMLSYYDNLLPIEYREDTNRELIRTLVNTQFMDGVNDIFENFFDVDKATGAHLDLLGKYVGAKRIYGDYNLTDEQMRILIKLLSSRNGMGSTFDEISKLFYYTFGTDVIVFNGDDLTISFFVKDTLSDFFINVLLNGGYLPVPQGVGVKVIIKTPETKVFGYVDAYNGLNTNLIVGYNDCYETYNQNWTYLDSDMLKVFGKEKDNKWLKL